ncbi:MAG: GNAT family N-acetyltransferase [Betaproteobacteria bacterium]|nr:MAG: GNAT family N-acetyltransferase [Betaproteobacteria bacterium]
MRSAAAIRPAADDVDFDLARGLFEEYARWLGVDLCFQGFAQELKTLPGAYAPPLGRLLLAGPPGSAFACIALRPLSVVEASSSAAAVGEVKRLYVQPDHRGQRWLYERLGFCECAPYYQNPLPGIVYMALEL